MLDFDCQISIDHQAKPEQAQIIQAGAIDHNEPFVGKKEKFCVFLKEPDDKILGGATGHIFTMHDLLYLDYVYTILRGARPGR
jgi:hypothetical protein